MTGAELIAAERQRQIDVEGWTLEHDDEHGAGEISLAADAYVWAAIETAQGDPPPRSIGRFWPWHKSWWKPSDDPIRNLVKAGALIAAEIDRLQRVSVVSDRFSGTGSAGRVVGGGDAAAHPTNHTETPRGGTG